MNGVTGFKLDGEAAYDYSGASFSVAGDINGDGHTDLLIGAPQIGSGANGRSYVVFGGPGVGGSGNIALSSLNGANGFKLDGETSNDDSGYSVSAAGDINGDGHADLLIGAPQCYSTCSGSGLSYVVFGGSGVGSSGNIALSSLNGANGFKVSGEVASDRSGWSVSTAGDINGDGYVDLLIGAYGHNTITGRSYMVFGGPGVGSRGDIALSSLNGINGFKLDGEATNDYSGVSVSAAGDINGDGIADILIGAYGYNGNTGRSYVVFGDIHPYWSTTACSLSVGATIQLNATYLSAYDRNHNNNTLVFIPNGVTQGQFEIMTKPGIPLVNFTQQQITSGAIQFVHDGSLVAPSYNITVRSTGIAWTGSLPAKITFTGTPQSYFPAVFPLANLNGQTGFKVDGEAIHDWSGGCVNAAGDINGDGRDDLLIGAWGHSNSAGRSYVLFGDPNVGQGGQLPLASLNGTNGFKLDGEIAGDQSGYALSGTGDVNGDGYDDWLVGAWNYGNNRGRSYVLFGGAKVGQSGLIALAALNGTAGFKLDGEAAGDFSGSALSAAGDINGDGYQDFWIGAYYAANQSGCSYLIFGDPKLGSAGTLPLAGLNATVGFKLTSESAGDWSGFSLSAIGDLNGDGWSDSVIGAPNHAGHVGRSYVLLGGPGIGQSGLLSLTTLTGQRGFKLDGETIEQNGYSVDAAGDVNGDGYADVLMGAPDYAGDNGRSYVLFGGQQTGQSGTLSLSALNGANGFKLDGETGGGYSGYAVSAGDFNGDGYSDVLIGAPYFNSGTGRSYVIWGQPQLVDGSSSFKLDGEVSNDNSGIAVQAVGDINADGVTDFAIGAYRHAVERGRTYVVFGDIPPTLVQNRLTVSSGGTISLNTAFLSAYDRNHPNNTLVFIPTNVTHGYFQLATQSGIALINFTVPQLQSDLVQFVHDGSLIAPSYHITVKSAGIAWTGPHAANISFSISPLSIVNNQLALGNGQTLVLSLNNLQAMDPGVNNSSQIIFTVGNVQNGYFATVPMGTRTSQNLTVFTQAQIQSGVIEFVHTGNNQAPSYSVLVSDGVQSTSPRQAMVSFADAPVITQNTLNITTGSTVTLTPALLNVTTADGSAPSQVVLTISQLQHAIITSNVTGMPVNNFTLAQLQAGQIQLTQDGSLITPSYTITAKGVKAQSSASNIATVYFSNQGIYAPQWVSNYLTVTQGEASVLTSRYLLARQPPNDQALDNQTLFYMSLIEHGHFSLIHQPQTWITSFSQQQLLGNQVQFVQDGSAATPGYQTAVQAFGLQSTSLQASIFFTPVSVPPPSVGEDGGYTTIQKAIIGAVISGTIGIFFAVLQGCLKRASNKKLLQALGEGPQEYDFEVVRPVAKEIARRIKVTGCMNYTTNTEMAHFKGAVRTILFELTRRGVDLNFTTMDRALKDGVINEIARQTRKILLPSKDCCGCRALTAFFKAQATPEDIEAAAPQIAEAVAKALSIPTLEMPKMSSLSKCAANPTTESPRRTSTGFEDVIHESTFRERKMKQGQFPEIIKLGDLNGQNGFKLDGENNGDWSGVSVSAAGDINGDGYADVVVGSNKGRSYLVFGSSGVGQSGVLLLANLNGSNGFKLDGENNGDVSGRFVSAAGDINGDGYADVVVGAPGYPGGGGIGRSYVVFGGFGVGQSGDLLLSSLNGSNGFKLDGENNGDASGYSISAAGDINGDGYNDLVIKAYGYPLGNNKGRSYVVFGGPGTGKTGDLLLSSLNGSNGFKLDGENNNDDYYSGNSVSAAGDINGDDHDDLVIGAWGYSSGNNKGRSYVVFGGLGVGKTGDLLLSEPQRQQRI